MEKWSNTEKLKVVRKAGELIVEKNWDEERPMNALYHAQFDALPEDRVFCRDDLLEGCGRPDTIVKSVANNVQKRRKEK